MQVSARGRQFIQKQEWIPRSTRCGWNEQKQRYFIYKDYKGFPTLACGYLVQPGEDWAAGITEQQAEDLFSRTLAKHEKAVTETFGDIKQNELDCWADFSYNEGTGRLDPKQNTAARLFIAGDLPGCAAALLMWDMTAGDHDRGLRARRAAEGYVLLHPYSDQDDHDTYLAPVAEHMAVSLEEALARGTVLLTDVSRQALDDERAEADRTRRETD